MSFPIHCGVFAEIVSKDSVFHFNLNGEIIRAKGKGDEWGHPHEWLKRTKGNDWIYYSTGGYTGVFEATGEYYLPNFSYSTNNLLGGHPFALEEVRHLTDSWYRILSQLCEGITDCPSPIRNFLAAALANTPAVLAEKGQQLAAITGGRISVLPPDARHVDYNLIPLTIADGCLYKCKFCKIKNTRHFAEKSRTEISEQIHLLKSLYGEDLRNYNALFLGEHDALQAGQELICSSIVEAYLEFAFADSYIEGFKTFLFGSATSLLDAPDSLFTDLHKLPGMTYINIGLESGDQETLEKLGKPISAPLVREAFTRMQELNDRFESLEITANFIMDDNLPDNHYPAILKLIRDSLPHTKPKGSIYFSPLTFDQPSRARLFDFNRLKVLSRLPTFLYIIQRL
ncbi:MAG: radical SAM domain-containing protein [Pseudomonadota bacterium]